MSSRNIFIKIIRSDKIDGLKIYLFKKYQIYALELEKFRKEISKNKTSV